MTDTDKQSIDQPGRAQAAPLDQAAWIVQARQLLDESARDLDAATASRLNRARQTALKLGQRHTPRAWLLPTGFASACAVLLAFAVWQPHRAATGNVGTDNAPAAVAMASANDASADDAPEMYQDLEFYAWLDAQAQGKDGDG